MQVPDYFRCPISHEIISDPVVAADGITYERKEIATWLTHHNTSPLTNIPLLNKTLIQNVNLRQAIEEYANQNGITLQRPLPLLPPIDLEHRSRDLIRARLIEESLPLAPLNTLKHYHEGGVEFYFCRLTEEQSSGKFGWGEKAIIANVERDRAFILTMGFYGFFFHHVQSKGIPMSDEYYVEGGGSRQDFEKGSSYWYPDTGCYFTQNEGLFS